MPNLAETFHVYFVDHRLVQRNGRPFIPLPIESGIDHDGFRNTPCIIAKVLSQILLFVAYDITEHFIGPAHCSCDCFCVWIKEELRIIETQSALRIVRTGDAKPVQLARSRIGQKDMPDMTGTLLERNPNIVFCIVDAIEQA